MRFIHPNREQKQHAEEPAEILSVLIIDDNGDDATLAGQALESAGIRQWRWADSGQAALGELERRSFDAVLLDVNMPRVNGLEMLQLLKRKYPATKVIMVTGVRDEQVAVAALKIGADDYISKDEYLTPTIIQSLRSVVDQTDANRPGDNRPIAQVNRESNWLISDPILAQEGDVLPASLMGPMSIMREYITEAFQAFPEHPQAHEELLLRTLIATGTGPRAVIKLYTDAMDMLPDDAAGQPSVSHFAPLVMLLARMVRHYQLQALESPDTTSQDNVA